MRIETELKLSYDDVLIQPKRSTITSRLEVNLLKTYQFRNSGQRYIGVPIIASNMYGVGEGRMVPHFASRGMLVCLRKMIDFQEIPKLGYEHYSITIGMSDAEIKYLDDYHREFPKTKFICMDVANGYMEAFSDAVRKVRNLYPHAVIIAGNVVTGDMTTELILAGADIVKVGIGQGAVCTTRLITGIGYPQLSAVIECADAAHGVGGHIIADGGIVYPGDVAKAFGAGADFVMIGSMFAGHEEGYSKEDIIEKISEVHLTHGGPFTPMTSEHKTKKYVKFYGNSSKTAQNGDLSYYKASEGRTVEIPIKGSIKDTLQEIEGGLRSACAYAGARTLKDLPKCTTFVRVTQTHNRSQESNTIGN